MNATDLTTAGSSGEELIEQLPSLPRDVQLNRVIELLLAIDECVERLGQLTCQAWEYLVQHELWEAGSITLEEVKDRINWPAVSERIIRHWQTQKRKDRDSKGIGQHWDCLPEEVLSVETWPIYASANLLQHLHQLSKACPLEKARTPLDSMIQQRLQRQGGYKAHHLLVGDVTRVIRQVQAAKRVVKGGGGRGGGKGPQLKVRQKKLDRQKDSNDDDSNDDDDKEEEEPRGQEEVDIREGESKASQEESDDEPETCDVQETQENCCCPRDFVAQIPGPGVKLGDQRGLALVRQALAMGLQAICHRHLRLLAAGALGLHNNKSRETISRRVGLVYEYRSRLKRLQVRKAKWFRRECRPVAQQDLLGVFRHMPVTKTAFDFDAAQVFERIAGPGSWQVWQEDGTYNTPGVFNYLSNFQDMIDIEFGIYRYHHHTPAGTSRLGWLRNMYYSLLQQLARQDPIWYALTAAARPDKQWRLISYPYITKDTGARGETTGFLHLDLDLEAYLADGQGGSRLTSSLSIDHEDIDGCTLVVKGFHRHLRAWHKRLLQQGWKGGGQTTNCSSIYNAEDRMEWGGTSRSTLCCVGGAHHFATTHPRFYASLQAAKEDDPAMVYEH